MVDLNTELLNQQTIPSKYQHLLTLDPKLVKQMNGKSIDLIVMECGMAEGRLHLQNKQLVFGARRILQNEQEKKVKEKVSNYDRFASLIGAAVTGALSVASAFAGPASSLGAGLNAFAGVTQATSSHLDKKADGEISSLDHVYQIKGSIIGENSQSLREADQNFDRGQSMIDRVQQSQQRVWEAVSTPS